MHIVHVEVLKVLLNLDSMLLRHLLTILSLCFIKITQVLCARWAFSAKMTYNLVNV